MITAFTPRVESVYWLSLGATTALICLKTCARAKGKTGSRACVSGPKRASSGKKEGGGLLVVITGRAAYDKTQLADHLCTRLRLKGVSVETFDQQNYKLTSRSQLPSDSPSDSGSSKTFDYPDDSEFHEDVKRALENQDVVVARDSSVSHSTCELTSYASLVVYLPSVEDSDLGCEIRSSVQQCAKILNVSGSSTFDDRVRQIELALFGGDGSPDRHCQSVDAACMAADKMLADLFERRDDSGYRWAVKSLMRAAYRGVILQEQSYVEGLCEYSVPRIVARGNEVITCYTYGDERDIPFSLQELRNADLDGLAAFLCTYKDGARYALHILCEAFGCAGYRIGTDPAGANSLPNFESCMAKRCYYVSSLLHVASPSGAKFSSMCSELSSCSDDALATRPLLAFARAVQQREPAAPTADAYDVAFGVCQDACLARRATDAETELGRECYDYFLAAVRAIQELGESRLTYGTLGPDHVEERCPRDLIGKCDLGCSCPYLHESKIFCPKVLCVALFKPSTERLRLMRAVLTVLGVPAVSQTYDKLYCAPDDYFFPVWERGPWVWLTDESSKYELCHLARSVVLQKTKRDMGPVPSLTSHKLQPRRVTPSGRFVELICSESFVREANERSSAMKRPLPLADVPAADSDEWRHLVVLKCDPAVAGAICEACLGSIPTRLSAIHSCHRTAAPRRLLDAYDSTVAWCRGDSDISGLHRARAAVGCGAGRCAVASRAQMPIIINASVSVCQLSSCVDVVSVTGPTGSGKTVSCLLAAFMCEDTSVRHHFLFPLRSLVDGAKNTVSCILKAHPGLVEDFGWSMQDDKHNLSARVVLYSDGSFADGAGCRLRSGGKTHRIYVDECHKTSSSLFTNIGHVIVNQFLEPEDRPVAGAWGKTSLVLMSATPDEGLIADMYRRGLSVVCMELPTNAPGVVNATLSTCRRVVGLRGDAACVRQKRRGYDVDVGQITDLVACLVGRQGREKLEALRGGPDPVDWDPGVMVFLPQRKSCFDAARMLRKRLGKSAYFVNETAEVPQGNCVAICVLCSNVDERNRSAVLSPTGKEVSKVVFSTSSGELGLTIPGVDIVLDSGLSRVSQARDHTVDLSTTPSSAAIRDQRKGRAGRIHRGVYVDLSGGSLFAQSRKSGTQEVCLRESHLKILSTLSGPRECHDVYLVGSYPAFYDARHAGEEQDIRLSTRILEAKTSSADFFVCTNPSDFADALSLGCYKGSRRQHQQIVAALARRHTGEREPWTAVAAAEAISRNTSDGLVHADGVTLTSYGEQVVSYPRGLTASRAVLATRAVLAPEERAIIGVVLSNTDPRGAEPVSESSLVEEANLLAVEGCLKPFEDLEDYSDLGATFHDCCLLASFMSVADCEKQRFCKRYCVRRDFLSEKSREVEYLAKHLRSRGNYQPVRRNVFVDAFSADGRDRAHARRIFDEITICLSACFESQITSPRNAVGLPYRIHFRRITVDGRAKEGVFIDAGTEASVVLNIQNGMPNGVQSAHGVSIDVSADVERLARVMASALRDGRVDVVRPVREFIDCVKNSEVRSRDIQDDAMFSYRTLERLRTCYPRITHVLTTAGSTPTRIGDEHLVTLSSEGTYIGGSQPKFGCVAQSDLTPISLVVASLKAATSFGVKGLNIAVKEHVRPALPATGCPEQLGRPAYSVKASLSGIASLYSYRGSAATDVLRDALDRLDISDQALVDQLMSKAETSNQDALNIKSSTLAIEAYAYMSGTETTVNLRSRGSDLAYVTYSSCRHGAAKRSMNLYVDNEHVYVINEVGLVDDKSPFPSSGWLRARVSSVVLRNAQGAPGRAAKRNVHRTVTVDLPFGVAAKFTRVNDAALLDEVGKKCGLHGHCDVDLSYNVGVSPPIIRVAEVGTAYIASSGYSEGDGGIEMMRRIALGCSQSVSPTYSERSSEISQGPPTLGQQSASGLASEDVSGSQTLRESFGAGSAAAPPPLAYDPDWPAEEAVTPSFSGSAVARSSGDGWL